LKPSTFPATSGAPFSHDQNFSPWFTYMHFYPK
jgi:hypothetical protein